MVKCRILLWSVTPTIQFCGTEAKSGLRRYVRRSRGHCTVPKRLLGKGIHYVMGRQMEPTHIVADHMRYLEITLGWGVDNSNFDRAVVSIPVAMDGDSSGTARRTTSAGINIVRVVHEPHCLYAHFRAPELGARTFNELTDRCGFRLGRRDLESAVS